MSAVTPKTYERSKNSVRDGIGVVNSLLKGAHESNGRTTMSEMNSQAKRTRRTISKMGAALVIVSGEYSDLYKVAASVNSEPVPASKVQEFPFTKL